METRLYCYVLLQPSCLNHKSAAVARNPKSYFEQDYWSKIALDGAKV